MASVLASDSVQDSPGLVLIGTAGFLLSAVYGYYWTAQCAEQKNLAYEAHAQMLLRQATDEFDTEPKPAE